MPARNVGTIAAAIARHTRGEVPMGEIFQAIQDASIEIQSKYDWPWTFKDQNIAIQPTVSDGTITVADGMTAVEGTGTAWSPAWKYKGILIGDYTYQIASVSAGNALELAQPLNQGQSFTNVGYTIYQQDYPLPADCEFGGVLMVLNPLYRYRLRYVPAYTAERQQIWLPGFFNNFQTGFADAGYDDATKRALIRFVPPPAAAAEYKLVYRRRVPDLSTLEDQTLIPQSFDRVIELMAEYLVRFNNPTPMPGWMEKKAEAYQLLQSMRRKVAIAPYDNYSSYSTYPQADALSFYTDGVFIGPVSA